MKHTALKVALVAVIACVVACSKQEAVEPRAFDAKSIAAEADKGNLGPLTQLNNACTAEVEKNGKRLAVCKVQDDVRDLRKPITIRF